MLFGAEHASRPPKKGEKMEDFAFRYGTTVKEMKNQWRQVERALANERAKAFTRS